MATNAYLDRLDSLQDQKFDRLQSTSSLPLQRPLNKQSPGMVVPQKPQEEKMDMTTPFGSNIDHHRNTDDRFNNMFNQYTDLANGLRGMVNQGFMPEQVAKMKLMEFLHDTRTHFANNPAQPLDNPQAKQALMGALQGLAQQKMAEQPKPITAPDIPQQDTQEVDNAV